MASNGKSNSGDFSFVVHKFGEAGVHTLGYDCATKIRFNPEIKFSDYGMVPTDITLRENEDTSVQSTCGDNLHVYSTGPGPVSVTIEGTLLKPVESQAKGFTRRGGKIGRRKKDQQPTPSNKDPGMFYKEYKATEYGVLSLMIDDNVYYLLLIDWEMTRSSSPDETGTFSLTLVGRNMS